MALAKCSKPWSNVVQRLQGRPPRHRQRILASIQSTIVQRSTEQRNASGGSTQLPSSSPSLYLVVRRSAYPSNRIHSKPAIYSMDLEPAHTGNRRERLCLGYCLGRTRRVTAGCSDPKAIVDITRPNEYRAGFIYVNGPPISSFRDDLKLGVKYVATWNRGGLMNEFITVTNLAASVGGLTWMLWDWRVEGWLDRNWVQLGYQLADTTAGISYSLVMTTIILWIMHFIPGCRLRTDEESEIIRIDDAEMGEFAYDYVAVDTELDPKAELADAPDHGRGGAGNIEESHSHPHSIEHEKVGPPA
ncbi:hypothetical protein M407DRAFT_10772 [Tulasnella calospora MUT 4182]|uniref:Ammonium transporter AmtB-like domain-containing protein n=1 Tax=Tulasnella calospora MUT 4182 TaxID=1051891 RepID=A0A0C3Q9J4_9AGAM|nr:hypothetical protein M407DRAFT_10772 [Tulasnella calospora MUT 4182]